MSKQPKIKSKGAALVTGGARRIGHAIALSLAEQGFDIALHYFESQLEAQTVAKSIRKKGVRCELFRCNLAQEKETLALTVQAATKFSNLNILINNASIFIPSQFHRDDLKLFNDHWTVHVKTPFILTSEFARICKKGQIINILDTNIIRNKTSYVGYLLSKKALRELTQMAAVQLAPQIRVNAVAPGIILPATGKSASYLKERVKQIPLQRQGNEGNITQSIKFLLDNDFLTGQIIFCDGGEHLV